MEEEIQDKSRTQKKKEAEALQNLGLELAGLAVPQLKRIEIPEDLRTALIEGKSITSNVAARRHRQFIGALMRDVDPELIRMALLEAESVAPAASMEPSETQAWVERLLTGDPADMEALLAEYPGLERPRLRQLVRNIKKEKPSGGSGARPSKSRKTLEQIITAALEQ